MSENASDVPSAVWTVFDGADYLCAGVVAKGVNAGAVRRARRHVVRTEGTGAS